MMIDDDNDGQMIFGNLGGLKFPDIWHTGEEKPLEKSPRKLVPTGNRTRSRCVTGAHSTAWPTAVDYKIIKLMSLSLSLTNMSIGFKFSMFYVFSLVSAFSQKNKAYKMVIDVCVLKF